MTAWPHDRLLIAALISALAGACGMSSEGEDKAEAVVEVEPAGDLLRIRDATQTAMGDTQIGVGNFWEEEYVDETGDSVSGMTAMLFFYYPANPGEPDEERHRVHPGQQLEVHGHRFHVTAIEPDVIELRVVALE